MLLMLLTLGVGQMWAGIYECKVTLNGVQKNVTDLTDDDWETQTDLTLTKFYVKVNKEGLSDLWGNSFLGYNVNSGPTTTDETYLAANTGNNTPSNWFNNGYDHYGEWNGTVYLSRNRLPGDYKFTFWFRSQTGSSTYTYYSNDSKNYNVSFTVPDPDIEISGVSSLVAGTSTNITASMSNYPVGATLTRVDVTGNISSAYNTGSGSSITVSSCTPTASGLNGITVTVTVTFGSAGTKTYTYKYNVLPPAVSDFTITATSGSLAGSGTSVSPYLVTYNGAITFSLSGADDSKAYDDANSTAQYSTDGSSYGTASSNISKTHSSVTQTTNQNWVYRAKLKNKSAALYGAIKEKTVYWKVPTYTVTLDKNSGSTGGTATATHGKNSLSISSSPSKTGYHVEGYYESNGSSSWGKKVATDAGALQASTSYTDESNKWNSLSNQTIYTKWTANKYDVTLKANTGTGDDQVVQATYDATMPTTLKGGGAITVHTKTGYNLLGYWDNASSGNQYYSYNVGTSTLSSSATWNKTSATDLYAHWSAKSYTLQLDVDEANQGTISGATTSQNVTYDAATTTVPNRPTAANGYALDGYYTDQLGEGTKVINGDGTWIASVLGYTDEDAKWVHDGDVTLYAYYKKAEITNLVAAPGVIAPGETITITPTIEPTPTGTTKVCWEVQYSNGTPLPSQPTFTPGAGNAVSFPVPSASATYIIQAKLAKGSDCPADPEDVLSTRTTTFQVAGEHTVTIRYQDSDGRTLQASASIEARPLDWTTAGDITPPTITGYTFDHWDAGDGVTIKNGDSDPVTTTTTSSIQIKAVYDGTLTAVYNKRNLIYFNNTLGWEHVYVYFYSSDKYWTSGSGSNTGTGASRSWEYDSKKPYYRGFHGEMTRIEGTNIYYWDFMAGAREIDPSYGYEIDNADNVVFTKDNQHDYSYFHNTEAVRRGDFNHSLSMFVPLADQTPDTHNGTKYYNSGYWMNYPENTGYVLKIYDNTTWGSGDPIQSIPFEFNADKTLPMSVNVELNASRDYGFEIHRADGTVLGENSYTLKSRDSGDDNETVRTIDGTTSERSKIRTAVAGDYIFKLNYGKVSSDHHFLIGVHYPVTIGDYRILYTDDAAWSKAAHSPNYVWWHESRTIHKENGAEDIVSFYVKYDSDTNMKFQYVSEINASTGAVTWTDVLSGNIDLSDITKDGVYNFYLTQADGGISVSKIEPYTGKYYIRTDCAGATKWENFRTTDHEMTYSEYTETEHGYSHYYPHWVAAGGNVKFCIANDYSPCITDTLVADYSPVIANIDAGGFLQNYGANIRFMWNQSTNKISRAYIGGSSNITDRFLVLEGDAKMFDAAGNALTGVNQDHRIQGEVDTYLGTDNQVILYDAQNFVYEREIKVQTGARAKLTATYNSNIEYFIGGADATIELLGGTESETKNKMRIVYDFKTNRLVTAYMPEGEITEDLAIHADLMIVREHQEAGQQLIFNGGSLSEVKTVYGVMRFNRWTLNNKETTGEHDPVGDPKSAYERGLYWISFPFDVNLSDVFGFGTYGTHWIIMEYDGAARATEGYWADSEGFWKYVTNRNGKVLEAGKGYVLALDLDLMKYNDESFWTNNIEQVELFFPSAAAVENIEATNVTTTVDEHECTIDRTNNNGSDINKNRTKADSHWNIIGIPSYANYGSALEDGSGKTITWNTEPYTNDLPFLYEWSAVDNSYAVQSGTTYPFKAMHAYMVQYHGDLYWSLASATPPSIVARSTYAEKPESVEMRIELQQNEMKVDQTFVKLSNDENASANFAFDEDLCKEFNANKANIYTIVENYLPVAGNTMPMSEQTTVIPVGVRIAADGEYTFSIPDGTEGIGVTLIDNETGIRTNLGLMDYTVTLAQGQIDDRFLLEISPISQISTDIEAVSGDRLEIRGARKIMIDGLLYIVKDGKLFDAQGRRL